MYTSFHYFGNDDQKRYWSIIARLRIVFLFKDGCYVGFFSRKRESILVKGNKCAKISELSFKEGG